MPANLTHVRAAVYVRISRDTEGESLGVQRQEEDCRALAQRMGYDVLQVYADNDVSASSKSKKARPGYRQMLADVEAGRVDVLLAYSTSRLTRRPLEFEELIQLAEQGLRIQTVAAGEVDLSTANGRAIARTLAAFDAREAEENSERARRERQQRRAAGRWVGGARPYGFEFDGTTQRLDEVAVIREAAAAILRGRSVASVARDLTARGVPTPKSRDRWRPGTLRDILVNPRAAGLLPDETRAMWEPVLDEGTWRGVRAILTAPGRRIDPGPVRLLTGIGVCGLCGATVNGGARVRSKPAPTYRCSNVRHMDRLADPVDEFVVGVLLAWLARERVTRQQSPQTAVLAREAEEIRARLAEAADLFADGAITGAQLARTTATLNARLASVEDRLTASLGSSALVDLPLGLGELRAWWVAADGESRRAVLRASGLQVTLVPPGRGAREFDPSTVRIGWRTAP